MLRRKHHVYFGNRTVHKGILKQKIIDLKAKVQELEEKNEQLKLDYKELEEICTKCGEGE